MKIGIAQIDCDPGNVDANLEKISLFVDKAQKQNCRMVVFPEMVDTGYQMDAIRRSASVWNSGPFNTLKNLAAENNLYIAAGISEQVEEQIYNSMAVFSPERGLMAKYRKIHLADYPPLNEGSEIVPGNELVWVEIEGFKFGLMICYDLRFPEMSRSLAVNGADVLLLVSAWPFPRNVHYDLLTRTRAVENQAYFIAANRTGKDGSFHFCGSSRIADPFGIMVASSAEEREEMIVGELQKELISSTRKKMPVFQHRRPTIYKT